MFRLLVAQYQAEVKEIIRYSGSKKKTSICNAFEQLLNDCCKPRNYITVVPDGTVKNAIWLEHGWWESKDQDDVYQWATWGKDLMDLHLNYATFEPYGLRWVDVGRKKLTADTPLQAVLISNAKLKADKTEGTIILDTETALAGVPTVARNYKLGNRSALEWRLDQYKERIPKDPTIAKLFNAYKFADYKEHVIDLLQRVCTVSVRTMEISQQMPDTVEHEGG